MRPAPPQRAPVVSQQVHCSISNACIFTDLSAVAHNFKLAGECKPAVIRHSYAALDNNAVHGCRLKSL